MIEVRHLDVRHFVIYATSSERLHNQMWLRRFDVFCYLSCLVAIIYVVNHKGFVSVYACRVVASCATVH